MPKSLSTLKQFLKPTPQKKVINNLEIGNKKTTKLASIAKAVIKSQLKNPWFILPVGAAATTGDPKQVAQAAITNFGYKGVNYNNIQTAKEIGPYKDIKKIKSIKEDDVENRESKH